MLTHMYTRVYVIYIPNGAMRGIPDNRVEKE